MNIHNLQP